MRVIIAPKAAPFDNAGMPPSRDPTGTDADDGLARGRALVDALRQRLARSGGPVVLHETHISWVLLAGDSACKIKKPVRLDFLDFRSLDARRACCEEELRLNRRLAPLLYLDVAPITADDDGPRFGGTGEVVEYAVRMRRFPGDALFSQRLAAGRLEAVDVERLAVRLAAFHDRSPSAAASDRFGTPVMIEATLRATLRRLQTYTGPIPELSAWLDRQAAALRPHWDRRQRAGRVREGHGDLHLANAIVLPGEVTAFDCLEFDPALRWIDVIDDIAFLAMDLIAHGRADLGWRFLGRYLEECGDYDGLTVLRVYLVHRALVRALVAAIRDRQHGGADEDSPARLASTVGEPSSPRSGPDYLGTARRLAATTRRPRLLITRGLSGSGKTVLSQALVDATGAVRVRSDLERKRLHGLKALEHSSDPATIYGHAAGQRTYERLLDVARTGLVAGFDMIVDATFLARADRRMFARLADELGAGFAVLECRAAEVLLRERIRQRERRGDDASEATDSVLAAQQRDDEPLDAAEAVHAVVVDTGEVLRTGQVLAALDRIIGSR